MGRFSAILIHVGCVLILASLSTSATISLADADTTLKQLTENYIQLKEITETRVAHLEAKVGQLETKNIQMEKKSFHLEKLLELKDQQLNTLTEKVTRLENTLQNDKNSWLNTANEIDNIPLLKSAVPRTCREARAADPSLSSGMYWIDPDGQGVGDGPIYVYCDMTSGSTSIPHNSELPTNVGHCADPGCYSRPVTYNASSRQMTALAELSYECHQSIQYDCNFAPFELNGVSFCWWNDKNGSAKYFWSGGNTDEHTCQCGIDQNCVEAFMKCNCDSNAPVELSDIGVITDKNILPITRLNFGRTQLESSSGVHTLGKFECSGQVAVNGIPKSCEDLWRIGHFLSGMYSVMGVTMVESVYCDFTKLPNDTGFQTWIGFEDVKSSSVNFYVTRMSVHYSETKIPIPFDIERLNVGGAMDLQTGKFTAPRTGKYFFSFTGVINFPASSTSGFASRIILFKNDAAIGKSYCVGSGTTYETTSLQSTLNLQNGDQIWLIIDDITSGAFLYGDYHTHFNGFLLEEEIVQSVNIL
ncbi:hypothetical protein DAPPUDRAFT_310805 [Daphnia pulex]|uniref:C1q domain-containing protein n=1 Tax=Daphnia pulex TaxID=6669 RepID=E9FVM4_DAPPU|nr:hypothetical protein DAPPUDRAFT_310805 [Daphnia pulex]|eukprot:EFX89078.1 hypothetical protein DAPPUDRAFT_310805 [Daphnia pulex]